MLKRYAGTLASANMFFELPSAKSFFISVDIEVLLHFIFRKFVDTTEGQDKNSYLLLRGIL